MIEHFYRLGIQPDWWKLPPLSAENWQQAAANPAMSCCWK
ncbi:2-deoxy-5-keto-D-gluconate 6-phosphate aldolase domain-containing protein [Enterobacter hormaechei]